MSARAQRRYVASLEDEARALLSALDARGVQTRDVVTFERAWHGFAATVDAKDLPGLQSLGVRLRANRRFYPAVSRARAASATATRRRAAGRRPGGRAARRRRAPGSRRLRRRGPRRRPAPGARRDRRAAAGRRAGARSASRARVVRVSASPPRRRPRRPGGVRPHGRAAGRPRARRRPRRRRRHVRPRPRRAGRRQRARTPGFADAPEAQAVARRARGSARSSSRPAGHEGAGHGRVRDDRLARRRRGGAGRRRRSATPEAVARTTLTVGDGDRRGRRRARPARRRGRACATSAPVDRAAARRGRPPRPSQGRLAVVRAGANPGAQAAAAAAAGAAAVLLAEPRDGRPLPAHARRPRRRPRPRRHRAPARRRSSGSTPARARDARRRRAPRTAPGRRRGWARFASRGPAFGGAAKPDLARPATSRRRRAAGRRRRRRGGRGRRRGRRARTRTPPRRAGALLAATDAASAAPGARRRAAAGVPVGTPEVRRDAGLDRRRVHRRHVRPRRPAAGRADDDRPRRARSSSRCARRGGALVERLTPPGGERGVLPGEYAYTLPATRARGPRAGPLRASASAPRRRASSAPTVADVRAVRRVVTADVVLYGRPGCHLCDDARDALERVRARTAPPSTLDEVDIDRRRRAARPLPGAHPGVALDGEELFELLRRRAASWRRRLRGTVS